jgi:hypothetical protein
MGEGNGTNGARQESAGNGELQDPKTGRFVKGNPGGPGRPRGALDLMTIARRGAKKDDQDLDILVWEAVKGLAARAKKGDPAAARELLNRLCGTVEKGSDVEVNVGIDARQPGPPLPNNRDLANWLEELGEAVVDLRRIEVDDTPDQGGE